ncbi:MAG: NAD(P)-binding protein [Planctomycetota bacterium]
MPTPPAVPDPGSTPPHAIIAGFGVPGRAAHEALCVAGWEVSVVERNAATVERCRAGMDIRHGDATDVDTLVDAGLMRAELFVIALPDEASVMRCIDTVRVAAPKLTIVARTYFTSSAYEAKRRGATEVVIAEQVIAEAMGKRVGEMLDNG